MLVQYRLNHIAEHGPDDSTVILVGNKTDLKKQRTITPELARQMADNNGIKYFECSTKENHNITEIFEYTIDKIVEDMGIAFQESQALQTNRRMKKCNNC